MSSEAVIYETGVPLSIGVSEYDYDNNMDRWWEITSANGNDLQLTFTDFNVESQSSCAYDAVEIYTDDDSFEEETFCGN